MATSAILNIILDPILIKVLGDGNGVLGAAFATIISQFVLMCMSFFYFIKKSDTVRIHKVKFEGKLVKPVLNVGVSAMLMQVMSMVQQTILSYGVLILSITFFQAIGKAGGASILALARQLVLFLPLVVILPHVAGLGVQGVFYAQLITDTVVLLLAIILMIKAFAGFKKA